MYEYKDNTTVEILWGTYADKNLYMIVQLYIIWVEDVKGYVTQQGNFIVKKGKKNLLYCALK